MTMPFSFWIRRRVTSEERGASAVEFAIIAPLFFMIVFGMFSGGLLYNEKSQLTYASREATRYGSSLPISQKFTGGVNPDTPGGCQVNSGGSNTGPLWACNVAKAAIAAAGGDLDTSIPGRRICVAIVQENTPNTVLTDSGGANYSYDSGGGAALPATCFSDGGADMNRRVHVLVQRNGSLNAVLFQMNITLTQTGVGRAEVTASS